MNLFATARPPSPNKVGKARGAAEQNARPLFVLFRRTVRATFGSASREYSELRDRRYAVTDTPPDEVPPPVDTGKSPTV